MRKTESGVTLVIFSRTAVQPVSKCWQYNGFLVSVIFRKMEAAIRAYAEIMGSKAF